MPSFELSKMEIQNIINDKKEFYSLLLEFIEDQTNCIDNFIILTKYIETQKVGENRDDLKELLHLISKISNNHYRYPNFFDKIEQILSIFESKIKQTFSNFKIFKQFKNNKRILLSLFEKKIIIPDIKITQYILKKKDANFRLYFHPEFSPFLTPEERVKHDRDVMRNGSIFFFDYENNRKIGQNDSYICELIRNDNVEDFISHVTKNNIPFSYQIQKSFYETNPFLIDKTPSLIEYSAFFGSIQIFQFLFGRQDKEDIQPSIWLYAIHGKNAEMIHFLEDNKIEPEGKSFKKLLFESIKCHHNDIANYIINNSSKLEFDSFDENIHAVSFRYYNYSFFPDDFMNKYVFCHLCEFDYLSFVKLLVRSQSLNINDRVILKKKIFFDVSIQIFNS